MPKEVRKVNPPAPSDADTVLRELAKVLTRHGWVSTGTQVDADGAVVVSGKVKPDEEPTE